MATETFESNSNIDDLVSNGSMSLGVTQPPTSATSGESAFVAPEVLGDEPPFFQPGSESTAGDSDEVGNPASTEADGESGSPPADVEDNRIS